MKAFTIGPNDAGQRLDRFIQKAAPSIPQSMIQRSIRIKRIKVNKKRAENSTILAAGDLVELYLNDEFFPDSASGWDFLAAQRQLDILYEDEHLLLLDKRPGLVVHEGSNSGCDTLINRVKRYLYEKGEYCPDKENSFAPALCNRIDRNTGGIVIAAKNAATLRVLNTVIRDRKIRKYYLCLVHGTPDPAQGFLRHYLVKDPVNNLVHVYDVPHAGAKTAMTRYRLLQSGRRYALLEIELLTGRTHQIRAQMAHIGHPLLGDGKYGLARDNKASGYTSQALYAYRLMLDAGDSAEHLAYLNGQLFEAPRIWFAEEFRNGKLD